MAVTHSASELDQLVSGSDLTVDTAREILDQAIAEQKISTASGRPVQGEMGYYPLRLAATGSTSHQFKGVQFGNSPEEDRRIRAAMWLVYKNTEAPASAQRVAKTDSNNRKTAARTGSQPTNVQFRMPDSHDRDEALDVAAQAIDQWLEDWNQKVAQNAKDTATNAVETLRKLNMPVEDLAEALGVDIETATKLLSIGKVQEAEEAEEDNEEEDES